MKIIDLFHEIDRELMLQEFIRYFIFSAIFCTACIYVGTSMKLNDVIIELSMLASCSFAMYLVFNSL
jgi:hypothetical protein